MEAISAGGPETKHFFKVCLKLELKKVRFIRSLSFVQGTTVNFLRTSFVFLLYYLVFRDTISPGKLMTLMFFSFFIFGPLQELGNVIAIYRETQVSLQNFQTILNIPKEPRPAHPATIGPVERLRYDRVTFRHQASTHNAVENISFEVTKGQSVAFVGPSGSGKTTLVKLLLGLYPPYSGDIYYNDIPGSQIEKDELREQIGFVSQDTQLFSGTIRENLLFVRPGATDEDCYRVLRQAACQSLLDRASNGLDTVIGEGGVKVSGGDGSGGIKVDVGFYDLGPGNGGDCPGGGCPNAGTLNQDPQGFNRDFYRPGTLNDPQDLHRFPGAQPAPGTAAPAAPIPGAPRVP